LEIVINSLEFIENLIKFEFGIDLIPNGPLANLFKASSLKGKSQSASLRLSNMILLHAYFTNTGQPPHSDQVQLLEVIEKHHSSLAPEKAIKVEPLSNQRCMAQTQIYIPTHYLPKKQEILE